MRREMDRDMPMGTFMVSYDLSKPKREYEKLEAFLRSHGWYARVLESVWFVKSAESTREIGQKIRMCVDSNDHFVVTPVSVPATVWFNLDPEVSDYLKGAA